MSSLSPSPSPSLSPSSPPLFFFLHHHKSSFTIDIVIGAVSFFLLILLLLLLFILHKKRNKTKQILNLNLNSNDHLRQLHSPSPTSLLHASSHPLTYLDAATDGFHTSLILGHGPLGTVYTATSISGDAFAVKRIHSHLILTNPGLDFSSRLKSLSFTNHPNVFPILGYSEAPGERVIITELSTSLEHYLHGNNTEAVIGWRSRIQIAAGAARGIEHLHGGGIVHGRVKASNIMVHVINPNPNSNYHVARVCDYGLSFFGGDSYYKLGFEGCMDDVLGFGVLLLEVLSGSSSSTCNDHDEMLGLIRVGRVEEMLDQRVELPSTSTRRALVRMAKVALACVGNGRRSRPEMGQVAAILNSLEMEVNNYI